MPPRGNEAGMTLIEMMAVLAIIGIAASATVLGIGVATRGPSVEAEAKRLAVQLQSAADRAMVDDRPVAIAWDAKGYALVTWDGRGWQPGSTEAFERHDFSAGIRMEMGNRRSPLVVGIDGAGIPAALALRGAAERWTVVFDGLTATAVRSSAT